MSWATVEQYVARYGPVADEQTLQECLNDATTQINALLSYAHVDYAEPSEEYAQVLMLVCRQMAHRAIGEDSSAYPFGITQTSQTAGPYTRSFSFGNPYGDLFLTEAERRMLGLKRSYVGSVRPVIDGPRLVRRCGDVHYD